MVNAVVGPRIAVSPTQMWEEAVARNNYTRLPGPLRIQPVGAFNKVHEDELISWDFVSDRYVRVTGLIE